ncbi:hypothetical protein [Caulobacter sp. 17J65-9]|uniref:hypothetical protein n=1 Tax=Caulobacter sp. 17J65-9 TaxID=2709382 RepID=UPI0013C54E35|nr:hypothetical protein [Caulobacter sp. 17J65-9]NEX91911.1 hypothetical protein [Caulobacter sp. 17J65-9]
MKPGSIMHALGCALVLASAGTAANAADGAAPAKATSVADCVWAATPDKVRSALLARRPVAAIGDAVSAEQAEALARACQLPLTGDSAVLVADTLLAHSMKTWSVDRLKTYGVSEAALLDAWRRLKPETRKAFSHAFSRGFSPPNAAYDDLGAAIHDTLRLNGEEPELLVFDFVAAQSVLERLQAS